MAVMQGVFSSLGRSKPLIAPCGAISAASAASLVNITMAAVDITKTLTDLTNALDAQSGRAVTDCINFRAP